METLIDPSAFRNRLLDTLHDAAANVRQAEAHADAGNRRRARLGLADARHDLAAFVQRLNRPRGRRLVPRSVASSLTADARSIRDDIETLAGTL